MNILVEDYKHNLYNGSTVVLSNIEIGRHNIIIKIH